MIYTNKFIDNNDGRLQNNLLETYPLSSTFLFRSTLFSTRFKNVALILERDHKPWTFYRSSVLSRSSFATNDSRNMGRLLEFYSFHSFHSFFLLQSHHRPASFDRVSKWLYTGTPNMFSINLSPINPTVGLTVFQREEIDISDMRNISKFILRIHTVLIYSWKYFPRIYSGGRSSHKSWCRKKWNWNLRNEAGHK